MQAIREWAANARMAVGVDSRMATARIARFPD
jgi:hypothetical protein